MRFFTLCALFCTACQFDLGSLPDGTCRKDGLTVICTADDAGIDAGGAGHAHGGAGASGAAGAPVAGAAGHAHGGLPVTLPLPLGDSGSSTYDVRQANDFPPPSGDDVGAFRNVCEASHVAFDDAIVYPGQPGRAHAHTFFGNTKADAFSTHSTLLASGNSTCRGGVAARGAYWFPSLLDGQGRVILPVEIHYYLKSAYNGLTPREITSYPFGIQAIVGDMTARTAQNTRSVWWDCVDGSKPRSATIVSCGSGQVAMNAAWPQCWDGRLDSPDHKSHLVHPVGGACPATHPRAIPELSIHVRYAPIPADARLSSDAADGLRGVSNHMDWQEAWDPSLPPVFLESIIRAGRDGGSHRIGDGRVMF